MIEVIEGVPLGREFIVVNDKLYGEAETNVSWGLSGIKVIALPSKVIESATVTYTIEEAM